MSHIALYRKYRPQTFDQVLGQENTVSYLQSVIKSGNPPHAMILTGGRGIGKTTLARIFAHELGIDQHDIYEIDAASNNGVDSIRQLREDVNTFPMKSKYKVYIFDEVHMFSTAAFNAFLKILEEPPQHVLFILATTELHKVLPTILSRCQVLRLKKPSLEILSKQIQSITKSEGKKISPEIAHSVAERADGSFRDALVILDQILERSVSDTISADDVAMLGLRSFDQFVVTFFTALQENKTAELITIISEVSSIHEKALIEFLENIIETMRMVLYVRYAKNLWEQSQEKLSDDMIATIAALSASETITPQLLVTFLQTLEDTKKSSIQSVPFELAIIGLLGNNATANAK